MEQPANHMTIMIRTDPKPAKIPDRDFRRKYLHRGLFWNNRYRQGHVDHEILELEKEGKKEKISVLSNGKTDLS